MQVNPIPSLIHHHFERLDSTNDYLLDNHQPVNQLVSAEFQNKGRGRRQQQWVDEGESLLFSLSTELPKGLNASAWPVVVAITLVETLKTMTTEKLLIKWPNDLYVKNAKQQLGKCAGILVESNLGKHSKIVTGIGINLAPLNQSLDSDYPIAHLSLNNDKKTAIANLGHALFVAWQQFINNPHVNPKAYQPYDMLANQTLIATNSNNNEETLGIGLGINEQGQLLLQQAGRMISLTSQQRIRVI